MFSRAPRTRAGRPGPVPAAGRAASDPTTKDRIFAAAAADFSAHGFDGVSVDAIAHEAGVNKAMIYYHFEGKLGLYREVVRDMLRAVAAAATEIAANGAEPETKIEGFIEALARLRDQRPWFPPLMMREMA
ncbi:MAG: helix-turn-helix domain-containing protein, partial [Acidobacteriota bacterium]